MSVKLTAKEIEVMELLTQGKRDAEIAVILGIRPRSVTHRVWSACNRLGAETRTQAVAMYLKSGH